MTPILEIAHVSKSFGTTRANDDISLTLAQGEIIALLGENGAGKTTLMSILSGHYTPDSGTIRVAGAVLPPGRPRTAIKAGIGMVYQHFSLAPNLTVLENVMTGTEACGRCARTPPRDGRSCWRCRRNSGWRSTPTRGLAICRWANSSGWKSSRRCTTMCGSSCWTNPPPS
jgi:nucleoside ABC transporter ATP-binding protein